MTVFVLSLVAGTASAFSGSVSGTNTVDKVAVAGYENGDVVRYEVGTSGSGSNELTVKFQQQERNGSWTTLERVKINAGLSARGSFRVRDCFTGDDELIRVRLSRKAFTKKIRYSVDLSS